MHFRLLDLKLLAEFDDVLLETLQASERLLFRRRT